MACIGGPSPFALLATIVVAFALPTLVIIGLFLWVKPKRPFRLILISILLFVILFLSVIFVTFGFYGTVGCLPPIDGCVPFEYNAENGSCLLHGVEREPQVCEDVRQKAVLVFEQIPDISCPPGEIPVGFGN